MKIRSNEQLIKVVSDGEPLRYLFFWGHQNKNKEISKSCLSQWYELTFEEAGINYLTAEHYMMHKKAILFNDINAAEEILHEKTAAKVKNIGRKIINFNEEKWAKSRFDIVVQANLAKFSSSAILKDFLISTGKSIIVEASPVDNIWGIGIASDNPLIENPKCWKGLNLLGYALMEVRHQLQNKI